MLASLGIEGDEREGPKHRQGRRHISHDEGHISELFSHPETQKSTSAAELEGKPHDSTSNAVLTEVSAIQGRHKPKDNLNLFSCDEPNEAPKFRPGKGRVNATEGVFRQGMHERGPLLRETDEQIRNKESQKFSMCPNSHFLGFEKENASSQKKLSADKKVPPTELGYGMADNLNNKPGLARVRCGKKILPQPVGSLESKSAEEVDGFPGLSPQRSTKTGRRVFG
ncbi:unnamed protein product [Phytomonas sp. Hart1]|nr:unnamed protein product [Phytomonas sp. Hart1]|eukprot:CCW68706.1 unnamed protein product [Phytomonas sp. isolate Hart1]